MGDALVTRMIKGPIHAALEACVNDYYICRDAYGTESTVIGRRKLLYDALTSLPPDEHCLAEYLLILKEIVRVPQEAAVYLAEWYNRWPEKDLREPIIRRGIICAIEAADVPPVVPIDFYWLGVGDPATYQVSPASYPFETVVTRSPWQVTCLLLTPPWPEPPSQKVIDNLTRQTDIWTVKDIASGTLGGGEIRTQQYGRLVITRAKALSLASPMQSSTVRRQQEARQRTVSQLPHSPEH